MTGTSNSAAIAVLTSDNQCSNHFSDCSKLKLNALQKENKKLKTNINALQEMLIIHEHSLEKCIHSDDKIDFKEWRNVFMEHLIENEAFLKTELKQKQSLNKEMQSFSKAINIQISKCENECNQGLHEKNTQIHRIKNQLNELQQYIIYTQSEKQNLHKKIANLESKLQNEVNLRHFYAQQIICLTKQNQTQTEEIKSDHQIIQNYELKVNHLTNALYTVKQTINALRNTQNDVNITIKSTLNNYLQQIVALEDKVRLKCDEILQTKKWIKVQFDTISNFHLNQYTSMNQQIVNINCKIDVLMNEFNHFKQKYQAQKQMKTKIRTKPKELQSPTLNPKHSNNHIVKLENLLELTKTLLDENEDEQIIKQLFTKTTSE